MTTQSSPPALGEQEAGTRRPFSDAIEAAAAIAPAKASQPEHRLTECSGQDRDCGDG